MNGDIDQSSGLLQRPIVRILGVVLIVGVLAGVAVLIAQRREPATNTANTNNPSAGTMADRVPKPPRLDVQPDADGDRLPDTDEETLGTNPQSSDTDQDGVFDYEEVRVWKTDPLNGDTDGDGRADGLELEQGDNPAGPGALRDINAAITNQ